MTELVIDERFCGPRNSGNGGYCAGLFAQVLDGPAEVTLLAPPPLNTPITISQDGPDEFEAVCGETLIAKGRCAEVAVDLPELPTDAAVKAAQDSFLVADGGVHLIPHCFVCGTKRAVGDGLRIFSGPVPGSAVNADFWTPGDEWSDGDGLVKPELLWAALDCPSAFALRAWPVLTLLGRFTVDIRRRPRVGERLIVAAWPGPQEGRKYHSSSVLLSAEREVLAAANSVWVALTDPAVLARFRVENA